MARQRAVHVSALKERKNEQRVLPYVSPEDRLRAAAQLELLERRKQATLHGPYAQFKKRYRNDPVGFVKNCIRWERGEGPTPYQCEIFDALVNKRRVCVRGPHGLGKTAISAWVVWWFALTRDGEDWKIATTAGSWRQLTKFLWPEIHKWGRRLDWKKIGRSELNSRTELMSNSLKLVTGEAFAVASNKPELMEGAHADSLLYIFDESKSIEAGTFDAAEGAFSGSGADNVHEGFALACSTPGDPRGRFYDIQTRKKGYEDWWVRHVTLEETIAAAQNSRDWAEKRANQWGVGSAVYQNRVLGEFAASDEDNVIPLAWVEAANERWRDWVDAGKPGQFIGVGADVADQGDDKTIFALRFDDAVDELRRHSRKNPMETANLLSGLIKALGGYAVVDGIGMGSGVVARLREQNIPCDAFIASQKSYRRDRTKELGFANRRSEAWWTMRELLDPGNRSTIKLPPDDELTGDLTAPRVKQILATGKLLIEGKDDLRKPDRLGRSPDCADAVIQIFVQRSHRLFALDQESVDDEVPTAGAARWNL